MRTLHAIGVVLGWLGDWRVLTVLAVAGVFAAYHFLGRWGASAVAAAALALILVRFGWQRGARAEQLQQVRAEAKAVETRDRIQANVSRAPPAEIRKRLAKWARD